MWHEKDISQCDDRIAMYKRIEPAQCAPDLHIMCQLYLNLKNQGKLVTEEKFSSRS